MDKQLLYILIICFILLCTEIFVIQYYFNWNRNECMKEPLLYGAKQMEKSFGNKFVGYGFIIAENTQFVITFDRHNVSVQNE